MKLSQILHVLEIAKARGQGLIVAAKDVDGEVLETLLKNNGAQELPCCAINFPGVGDWNLEILADLAAFVGAKYFKEEWELKNCGVQDLGTSKRVNIDSFHSVFFEGAGDITDRTELIQHQMGSATGDEAALLKDRLQKLKGKMAVLEVGCSGGQTEMQERRDRIVDALNSVKSALNEGLVPGGGAIYFYAGRQLKAHKSPLTAHGVRIVSDALQRPLRHLVENSGIGLNLIEQLDDNLDEDIGIDVNTGSLKNMLDAGIIDSAHVAMQAVETACSIGGMVLSAEVAVVRTKAYNPPALSTYNKEFF